MKLIKYLLLAGAGAAPFVSAYGQAQTAPGMLDEIIVTAQKRSQSINEVPMSITALSAEQMRIHRITSVADLAKVVPGLTAADSNEAPVFTLRGVGFLDTSISASPTVTVYVDQVPIGFPVMTRSGLFDMERVEVLKGPQGTLFGANATGGAINFIPAKPAENFEAGISLDIGRFDTFLTEGYISGSISETLNGRLSMQSVQSGSWQNSVTDDRELGEKDINAIRLLLDWKPIDTLTIGFNVNGWRDKSDTLGAQLLSVRLSDPTTCAPEHPFFPLQCISPELAAIPLADDSRDAGWGTHMDMKRNDSFDMASVRIDWEILNDFTLTSITSYQKYDGIFDYDGDGTPLAVSDITNQFSSIESLYQELRLTSSDESKLQWMVGLNYQDDDVSQNNFGRYDDGTSKYAIHPLLPVLTSNQHAKTATQTYAIFGNMDYSFNEKLVGHFGIRYTDSNIDSVAGHRDTGDGSFASAFNAVLFSLTGQPGQIQPGEDFVITLFPDPNSLTGLGATTGSITQSLNEENTSWRVGLDYFATPEVMIYGNISRGYKAGSIPYQSASSSIQHMPAVQEEVIAYELGTKSTLLNNSLQFNTAIFYYDYKDKQLRGRIPDPVGVFGALAALVNVPESRIMGIEVETVYQATERLKLLFNGTYIDSEVSSNYLNYDPFGNQIDFEGMNFPLTPEFSGSVGVEYSYPLGQNLEGLLSTNINYQSKTTANFNNPDLVGQFATDPLNAPGVFVDRDIFKINDYALWDARAGVSSIDGQWSMVFWVKNISNEYYRTYIEKGLDTITAYAGMPRTYGVAFNYNW